MSSVWNGRDEDTKRQYKKILQGLNSILAPAANIGTVSQSSSDGDTAFFYAEEMYLPSLEPFESGLKELLERKIGNVQTNNFNRLEFDFLLESALDLLGQSISLKDDGMELTIRYLHQLSDLERARSEIIISQNDIQSDSDYSGFYQVELRSSVEKLKYLKNVLKEHQEKFEKLGDVQRKSVLGLSLSLDLERVKSQIHEITFDIEAKEKRILSLKKQLDVRKNWNTLLLDLSHTTGVASNFKERIDAFRDSFRSNIAESYVRLLASYEGILHVYPDLKATDSAASRDHFIHEVPQLSSNEFSEVGFTDTLLEWARDTVFCLERYKKLETEYRRVISLSDLKVSMDQINRGEIANFEVPKSLFPRLRNAKLIGFRFYGVWDGIDPEKDTFFERINGTAEYSGIVRLPPSVLTTIDKREESLIESDIPVGDIGLYRGREGAIRLQQPYRNINPYGNWRIKISEKPNQEESPNKIPFNNVLLEVIVSGLATDQV